MNDLEFKEISVLLWILQTPHFYLIFGWVGWRVRVMVFNATFNNISVISWRSVLLVDETRVAGENHRPAANHLQTFSHNVISSTHRLRGIQAHNVSCNSNYHTITTTTASPWWVEVSNIAYYRYSKTVSVILTTEAVI